MVPEAAPGYEYIGDYEEKADRAHTYGGCFGTVCTTNVKSKRDTGK
jgi:hypothetical protein